MKMLSCRAPCWKSLKSGAPSAKMTKRADPGRKTIFCANSWTLLKIIRVFSPRAARFVIFALGAPLVSDFKQSARHCTIQRFQLEISRFCYFRTGCTTFLRFSAKCTGLCKTAFPVRDRHVLSFSHRAHHFFAISSKVHGFVQNSVFSPSSEGFAIIALCGPLFSDF